MMTFPDQCRIVIPSDPNDALPIDLNEARLRHINYLEQGPHIYVAMGPKPGDEQILHSLRIDQDDLDLLYRNARQGIRLHFCREASGMLNVIAVPVGEDNSLVIDIDPERRVRPIVNTLEPCPTLCPPPFSETSMNCWMTDELPCWVDPNDEQDGRIWFRRGMDGQKQFIDRPDNIPPVRD